MAKKRKTHFLITAGGTREYIDPVRFISNASSGKMGYALADAAKTAGHKVTLISAAELQPPVDVDFVGVESAKDMFEAVKKFFADCDCLIMAAAVSDYTPQAPRKTKIKKQNRELTVKLKPTADILAWAGRHKYERRAASDKGRFIVGFALEDKNIEAAAEKKLTQKNLDMIIANSPEVINSDQTKALIKTPSTGWRELDESDKISAAREIIRIIEKNFA